MCRPPGVGVVQRHAQRRAVVDARLGGQATCRSATAACWLAGTIGPASLPVAGPDGVGPGPGVSARFATGAAVVDAGEVQAVTVTSAAAATVSATAPPRTALRSRFRSRARPPVSAPVSVAAPAPARHRHCPPSCPKGLGPRSGGGGAVAFLRVALRYSATEILPLPTSIPGTEHPWENVSLATDDAIQGHRTGPGAIPRNKKGRTDASQDHRQSLILQAVRSDGSARGQ